MALLTFEFFFRLLWGWNLYLIFISRNEASEDFLKVAARFSLGFAGISLLAGFSTEVDAGDYLALVLIAVACVAYLSRAFTSLRLAAIGIILFSPLLAIWDRGFFLGLNFVLSGLILGGAFVGQFLGHWYLNVPNIHIREFKRITLMALLSIGLRVGVIAIFLMLPRDPTEMLASGEFFDLRGDFWRGLSSFGTLLFASRVLWGLVATGILTWMAKKTVDMRSTQSATGIFYANSVLMLLGELCALYLEKELKWPI